MEFSWRLSNDLSHIFRVNDTYTKEHLYNVLLENNNLYSKSLKIDINKSIVEVPIIARGFCEKYITEKLQDTHRHTESLIMPLYSDVRPQDRRTFDSIIHQIMSVNNSDRLVKITTNKGEVYYGGTGLLLDKDFNPLMMCTAMARWKTVINEAEVEYKSLEYYRLICRVSPKVFTESTKLMEKGIIKKVIPYYSTQELYITNGRSSRIDSMLEHNTCQVIVDNMDGFFITPVKPTPSTCSDEILNQCLVDNLDDILSMI